MERTALPKITIFVFKSSISLLQSKFNLSGFGSRCQAGFYDNVLTCQDAGIGRKYYFTEPEVLGEYIGLIILGQILSHTGIGSYRILRRHPFCRDDLHIICS